jgi:hypothetical protein
MVWQSSYPKYSIPLHKSFLATRNWLEQRCHLRNIRGNIVWGLWSKKVRCGNVLTRNISIRCSQHRERLAIGQNRNVTCGTIAEASSVSLPAKKRCCNVLPVIAVHPKTVNPESDWQLSNTAMSPAEYSRSIVSGLVREKGVRDYTYRWFQF